MYAVTAFVVAGALRPPTVIPRRAYFFAAAAALGCAPWFHDPADDLRYRAHQSLDRGSEASWPAADAERPGYALVLATHAGAILRCQFLSGTHP